MSCHALDIEVNGLRASYKKKTRAFKMSLSLFLSLEEIVLLLSLSIEAT